MKKLLRILCGAALCCVFLLPLLPAAAAAGSVSYDGGARSFIFAPGSKQSPTDLFGGFKQIMPGDTLIDTVDIRTDLPRSDSKVRLYLRATGIQKESKAGFLGQLRLRVEKADGGLIFDSTLDTATGDIYLGTFKNGDRQTLDMTLYAPIGMKDIYQDAIGLLGWEFTAEEVPGGGDGPKTGDDAPILLLSGLLVASLLGAAVTVNSLRRSRKVN